jgi:hypothetical protein
VSVPGPERGGEVPRMVSTGGFSLSLMASQATWLARRTKNPPGLTGTRPLPFLDAILSRLNEKPYDLDLLESCGASFESFRVK